MLHYTHKIRVTLTLIKARYYSKYCDITSQGDHTKYHTVRENTQELVVGACGNMGEHVGTWLVLIFIINPNLHHKLSQY